jgi:effector-binding domain-containing protein
MLRLRRAELERQVDDNRHRVAQIDARLRLIESEYEMSAQEIVVKHVEPMRIAALSDLIEPDVPEPSVSDEALRVYAGFAVTGNAPGLQIVEMPAAEVASVIHRGPMEGIGQADRALAR